MTKSRLEAFTDAVIAIIMTILVLELAVPKGASFTDLFAGENAPMFIAYAVSFFNLAVYWNNHHHMFHIVKKIDGRVLWTNNIFMFFLSLFPFTTAWMGEHINSFAPQFIHGVVILGADAAWLAVQIALVKSGGKDSHFAKLYSDYKKNYITLALNVIALLAGFIAPILIMIINVGMTMYWILPERKVEKAVKQCDIEHEKNKKSGK
ncbi:MAG: TMEM175 family protein [Lactobacillales bacterium]|jgi:uncharacterized membrane protein|nr:TMEM175 family protein [Lactobacillales bacterium]